MENGVTLGGPNVTDATLRRATIHDALLFYALRLDPETRRFTPAFDAPLTLEEHVTWFADRVWTSQWYVAERDGQPAGIVRLDTGRDNTDRNYVSVIVAPSMRGRGIGLAILQELAAITPGPRYACIHHLNAPSVRVFERAGYEYTGEATGVWRVYRRN